MMLSPTLSRFAQALGLAAAALLAITGMAGTAQAQTVRNTATLTHAGPGGDVVVPSNTVQFDRERFVSKISFRRIQADWTPDFSTVHCTQRPRPTLSPVAINEAQFAATTPLASLDVDNPFVIVLDAQGENHDPTVRETTIVVGHGNGREVDAILTETGVNTGIFAGAFPPVPHDNPTFINGPCNVTSQSGWLTVTFAGDDDDSGATAALLIDPLGHVFDSRTGQALNGATVTIINDDTGQPAQVFGDDGITAYPSTMITGQDVYDASGWRYYMEDGDFRFPLVAPGRYRLVVTPPAGYTFPSTATQASIAGLLNPHGVPFTVVAGSYGGAFNLNDPNPVTIDIPVDPRTVTPNLVQPRLILDKQASVREAELGDVIQYRVEIRNTGAGAASDLVISDTLPQGLRYKAGTTKGAAEPVISSDGRHLSFRVGALAAGGMTRVSYLVEVAAGAPVGEAVNRATVSSVAEHSTSNESSASVSIRVPLFTDGFTVIGRVTEGACGDPERGRKGVPGIRLLMEDGSYVVTDKDGFYHFEGVSPGTHVVQIDLASVPATHAPVACDADTRASSSAISRFVEAGGGSLQRVDFQLAPTGKAAAPTQALPVNPLADAEAAGNRDDWLDRAEPGVTDWLFPQVDHNPRAPAVRVVIAHGADQRVALTINGKPVDTLSFDGTDTDRDRGVAISRWTGLPLIEGDNLLEARVLNADGSVNKTLTRIVHYANTPAQAVYVSDKSRLVADGLTRPLIAVRVTDRSGNPVRAGTTIPFRVDQPYRPASANAAEQSRQFAGMERTQVTAQVVGDDGLAFIALEPTRQPGLARITITLANRERGGDRVVEVKAWLASPPQDWVVVGFAKGTLGADLKSGGSNRADADGQIAFYAKGRITGSWVVTAAYDSARNIERSRDRGALGTIDPDRYYSVYGDGTIQAYDAATRRKLYVRLETRNFYALFGDFETGLVDTKLGRYSRTLTGMKAEYTGHGVRFTGFAANDDSRYARDEIQGNGLSGPYRLSHQNIVPNTDKLRLETRDRLRPELVVESRELTRHIDYDIDPDAGTIRFREPILSRDANLNPVFIVADYELHGDGNKLVAGGRAAVTVGPVEVGASVLHDETNGKATVVAVDFRARISATTEVRAEAATGGRQGIGTGHAFLVEAEHRGSRADALVYFRQQDRDFGLGQQNLGEAGTRKIGFDTRLRLNDRWSITGAAWHQQDLDGSARRIAGEGRIEYRRTNGTLYAGIQFASDRGIGTAGNETRDSRLVTLGGTQRLFNNRLEVTAEAQMPLGGKDDSVDFPARQRLQAAWRFSEGLRVIAGYEIAKGEKFSAQTARIGFDVTPWSGARIMATLNHGGVGENGERSYAQYGLSQSLPIGKRWTIDATLDSSSTFAGTIPVADVVNRFHPVASGGFLGSDGIDGDFVAVTLGATYRGDRWSWNGRAEYRTGPREERWGLTSNLLQSLGNGSTLASSVRAYRLREQNGSVSTSIRADVAVAIRPVDSPWALLNRLQVRSENAGAGTTLGNALAVPTFAADTRTTLRVVNNLAVNYRSGGEGAGHGFEASLYYGLKYIRGRYADERYDGLTQVGGIELRKDIDPRFDLGLQASVQHNITGGAINFSAGVSAGFSPTKDVWVSAGYNVVGYRDRDFEDARWTRQGPFVTVRLKFDQSSFGGLLGGAQ